MSMIEPDYLLLKWGVPKGWSLSKPEHQAILQRYYDLGESISAMTQPNTDAHREVLCELIDVLEGEVQNDWTGEYMTKDEAKAYVRDYRK